MKTKYNEKNLKPLTWHEAIRKRPGMYLGSINQRGLIRIIKYLLSFIINSSNTNIITIKLKDDISFRIKFENLDVSLSKNLAITSTPYDFVSLAFPTINALSTVFKVKYFQKEEKCIKQIFEKGILKKGEVTDEVIRCQNIEIEFTLDKEIWDNVKVNSNYLLLEIQDFSYLHSGIKFKLNYQIDEDYCQVIYHFKNGLKDRIDIEKWKNRERSHFEAHFQEQINNFSIEVAFAFIRFYARPSFLKSYVNDYQSCLNGTHVDSLLKGLADGIMMYLEKYGLTKKYIVSEKKIKETLIASINIKLEKPKFRGSTKSELANAEIIGPISNYIANFLFSKMVENENDAKELISNFEISEYNF